MLATLLLIGVALLIAPVDESVLILRVTGAAIVYLAITFASVQVTVTGQSVAIGLGPLHWPRKTIVLADVEAASTMRVRPLRYGGWGYRWCGRGCRAYVIRTGEGLRIRLKDGKSVIVTVDDAAAAAGLIGPRPTRAEQRRRVPATSRLILSSWNVASSAPRTSTA